LYTSFFTRKFIDAFLFANISLRPSTLFRSNLSTLNTELAAGTLHDTHQQLIKDHYFSFPFLPIPVHLPSAFVRAAL